MAYPGSFARVVLAILVLDSLAISAASLRLYETGTLQARDASTNANCLPEFSWMTNSKGKNPCLVAAEIIAPCHGGSWVVPALDPKFKYDPPSDNRAESCTCSWAAYNLISACAECQGIPQAIRPWPDYILSCPASAVSKDYYYPPELFLADSVGIPAWAAFDASKWKGSTWNLQDARSLRNEGNPDVGVPQVPSTEKKTSSAGPIAGGVVGGVVVILSAAALAFFLLKRHRKKAPGARGVAPSDAYTHYRSPSDATDKSGVSMGYTNLSTTTTGFPSGHGRTPTVRTHNTSIYPFSTFGAPDQVTAPPPVAHSPSPPPTHSRQTSGGRDDIITPFTLQHPVSDTVSADRKSPLGSIPRYDSPNAPPTRAEDVLLETPQRGRLNPPAYSTHDSPSPPPMAAGPSHVKTRSADTHRSQPSFSGSVGGPQARVMGANLNQSVSDIVTTPGDALSGVPEGTTYTLTSTGTTVAYPRDLKRQPTDDSLAGRDLA